MTFSWAASLAPRPGTSSQVTGKTAGFNKASLKRFSGIIVLSGFFADDCALEIAFTTLLVNNI
jgi:hypothetical protein